MFSIRESLPLWVPLPQWRARCSPLCHLFTDSSARNNGRGFTGPGIGYGEGFYVGDADNNLYQSQPDTSSYVTFYNCYATDTRSDGLDTKEGAHHVGP